MADSRSVVPVDAIASLNYEVRGHRVMLDSDLAQLYGVATKRLNEQVKRDRTRFPEDFAFRVTAGEVTGSRSRNATSKVGRGGRGRVLDFGRRQGYIADIYSLLDQPSGLRRGFVFRGQASQPVRSGGWVHAT